MGAVVALFVVALSSKHQRNVARDAREIEAIAGFVAAIGKAYEVSRTTEPSTQQDIIVMLLTSTARLRLASKRTAKIAESVDRWPSAIQNLITNEEMARQRELHLGVNVRMLLSEVYEVVLTACPKWPNASSASRDWARREKCLKDLKAMSAKLNEMEDLAERALRARV
ncbi:hypothetical protein [Pseudarthrobacter sp. NKDBFgelt]|uniref:hypothetical protein n=1 Tax=Pseudarthrobacter sp. NKDBFgelt TaxID=3384443 RepID=UPI0038D49868